LNRRRWRRFCNAVHHMGRAMAEPHRLRLVVDLNRCEAYAQCCFLAPSVFELHGEEALFYDPEPSEAERDRVLRAATACPVQAITVEAPPGHNGRRTPR
jgi:ferredoxin